ncbi:MAG TPA: hypothetical protein VFE05_02520 [Longimicrobiaceae bacterium]|jgi:hypothetical protein|nr:hypothetical protein [Longimicrobiaceae bacterium]
MEMIHPGGYFPAGRPLPGPDVVSAAEALAGGWDAEDDAAPEVRAERLHAGVTVAEAARVRMDFAQAGAAARVAEMARRVGAAEVVPDAVNEMVCHGIMSGEGDLDDLARLCEEVASGEATRVQRGRALANLGVIAGLGGDPAEAVARFDAAARLFEAERDVHGRVLAGVNRANALAESAHLRAAEKAAADTLRLARSAKHEHWTAMGQMAVGLVHLERGSRNQARAHLGEAVRGFARSGDALRQVQCWHVLGEIAYDAEDPIRAGAHYRDGLSVARQAGAGGAIEVLTLLFEHR